MMSIDFDFDLYKARCAAVMELIKPENFNQLSAEAKERVHADVTVEVGKLRSELDAFAAKYPDYQKGDRP